MKLLAVFTPVLRLFSAFVVTRFDREGHSHLFILNARYVDIVVAQTSVESTAGLGGWA